VDKITRDQFIDCLENDWASFVSRFDALSPEEQRNYLRKQGYRSFGDLLAHIIAWWEDGSQVIDHMIEDPDFSNPDYNVDEFNARAVERFMSLDEIAVVQSFEFTRDRMVDLVRTLRLKDLEDERINTRLYYEIIQHLKEHSIDS
jgi:hypothetical protein